MRLHDGKAQNDLLRICDLTKVLCSAFLSFCLSVWATSVSFHVYLVRRRLLAWFILSPWPFIKHEIDFNCLWQQTTKVDESESFFLRAVRMLNSDFCAWPWPLWIHCSALHVWIFTLKCVQNLLATRRFYFFIYWKIACPPKHQGNIHFNIYLSFYFFILSFTTAIFFWFLFSDFLLQYDSRGAMALYCKYSMRLWQVL